MYLLFIHRKLDANFELAKFEQLFTSLHSILTPLISEDRSDVPRNPIEILRTYFKHDTSLVDIMVDANGLYGDLSKVIQERDIKDKMKAKMFVAQLSFLTSLIFIKINAEVSPVDHVEKYRLKAKYIKEDIETFDTLLSAYYMHGLVSGTVTSNRNIEKASDVTVEDLKENSESLKKVHPYCGILMEMKNEIAERIHKYAAMNTFRPAQPSYNAFVQVRLS